MNLLSEGIRQGNVLRTDRREKHSIDGQTRDFDVYRIKTDLLYYNDQNDRIATWISEYNASHDTNVAGLDREEFNKVIEEFIVQSNPSMMKKTQSDIALRGQLRPGVVLNDGRVIDGNRRLTCVRRIAHNSGEPGWFEAVILDDATGSDVKRIKLLELAIQIGEEEKVPYDPVDRLVGVYRDVIKNALITPAEYGKATGLSESEVQKLIDRAKYMEEFLEFCGAPEQYHLARSLKVDGPLGEFTGVLNKQKNERSKQLVKQLMFANIVVQPEGDITRYVRDFKKVAGSTAEQEFYSAERKAMTKLIDEMGSVPLTCEKVSELRANEALVDEFKRAGDRARNTVKRERYVDTPAKKSAEAIRNLDQILPEMLNTLDHDELDDVRRSLCLLIDRANQLIKEIESRG